MKHKRFQSSRGLRFCTFWALFAPILIANGVAVNPIQAADTMTLVLLVRHAEKETGVEDPPLSPAGMARARALAAMLADAGIEHIHSTDFRRTRGTAAPLARQLGLDVSLYDPGSPERLLDQLLAGGRHLVIGHSNTVPELVELLGGDGGDAIDDAGEYDRLYMVAQNPGAQVETVLLHYGKRFDPH